MKMILGRIVVTIVSWFFRVEVKGIENVPDENATLLCANHVGGFDMLFIGYKLNRLVHYMAKAELFKIPVLKQLIKAYGAFPVNRGRADITAVKGAYSLLDKGEIVGIFPEGTRRKAGKKVKIHSGAVNIALKKNVPILPVGIKATYKMFSKVEIVFGEPYFIDYDAEKKYTIDEIKEMSENLMRKIYSLVGEDI